MVVKKSLDLLMSQLPSLSLPDALFNDETLDEVCEVAAEPSAVPSAGPPDGKKGPGRRSKYMNILDFVKKAPKQSTGAQAPTCTQPLKPSVSAFERPLAKTDLSYPLPTHAVYTTVEDIEAFSGGSSMLKPHRKTNCHVWLHSIKTVKTSENPSQQMPSCSHT